MWLLFFFIRRIYYLIYYFTLFFFVFHAQWCFLLFSFAVVSLFFFFLVHLYRQQRQITTTQSTETKRVKREVEQQQQQKDVLNLNKLKSEIIFIDSSKLGNTQQHSSTLMNNRSDRYSNNFPFISICFQRFIVYLSFFFFRSLSSITFFKILPMRRCVNSTLRHAFVH